MFLEKLKAAILVVQVLTCVSLLDPGCPVYFLLWLVGTPAAIPIGGDPTTVEPR